MTAEGAAAGYTLTTFATGFVGSGYGMAPLALAFPEPGRTLVTDCQPGLLYRLGDPLLDNHVATAADIVSGWGEWGAFGLAQIGNGIYMTSRDHSAIHRLTLAGQYVETIAHIYHVTGITVNPNDNHLLVSDTDGYTIWDVDPVTRAVVPFWQGSYVDGLETDGEVLYFGALEVNRVYGVRLSDRVRVFDSGPMIIRGADGIALGRGALADFIYINANTGRVLQISKSNPAIQTIIAEGGSRGDFVAVAPDGSLLLTQSDRVMRLRAPPGGSFGGAAAGLQLEPRAVTAPLGTTQCVTAHVIDDRGADFPNAVVSFSVTGANTATSTATTGSAGNAELCYPGSAPGLDTVTASYKRFGDNATVTWVLPQACPAVPASTVAVGTRLTYAGGTSVECGGSLAAAAVLVDENGTPVADGAVSFAVAGGTVTATTDGAGRAWATVAAGNDSALVVSFPGDAVHAGTSTVVGLVRALTETTISYTGTTSFRTGTTTTVSAVVTGRAGTPLAGVPVTFLLGSSSAAGTSGADGTAVATLVVPATTVPLQLTVASASDGCFLGQTVLVDVEVRSAGGTAKSFVVWGGNKRALETGQTVNVYGPQWWRQAKQGDYQAEGEFKGFAVLGGDLAGCQAERRTTTNPRLTPACWTSATGMQSPPSVSVGQVIDVAVTTSVAKGWAGTGCTCSGGKEEEEEEEEDHHDDSGGDDDDDGGSEGNDKPHRSGHGDDRGRGAHDDHDDEFRGCHPGRNGGACRRVIFGNIAQVARVRVTRVGVGIDAVIQSLGASGSAVVPGEVVLGTAGVLSPGLAATVSLPGSVLPGESVSLGTTVGNAGTGPLAGAVVSAAIRGAAPAAVTASLGPVAAGGTAGWTGLLTANAVAARNPLESSEAYEARLAGVEGSLLSAQVTVTGSNETGQPLVPLTAGAASVMRLPRLVVNTQVEPCGGPGQAMPVVVTVSNAGSADAAGVTVGLGGSTTLLGALAAGASQSVMLEVFIPSLAARGVDETEDGYHARLAAADALVRTWLAQATWLDALGNAYGPVEREVRVLERVGNMMVAIGAPQFLQPGVTTTIHWLMFNAGTGNAYALQLGTQSPGEAPRTLSAPAVEGTQGVTLTTTYAAPAVSPRSATETSAAYLQRLTELAAPKVFTAHLEWRDARLALQGPVGTSATARVAVPVLTLDLSGPAQTQAGGVMTVEARVTNTGTATARGVQLRVLGPAGTATVRDLGALVPGQTTTAHVPVLMAAVGLTPTVTTAATVSWSTLAGAAMGPVEAETRAEVTNTAPQVDAGQAVSVLAPGSATLQGSVVDDGLPSGTVAVRWTQVAGPAEATMADATALRTAVWIAVPGQYRFLLSASDGALSGVSEVAVSAAVLQNQPPSVSAGADQVVVRPQVETVLRGQVLDDGLPAGSSLVTAWQQLLGPAAAVLGTPGSADCAVRLPANGLYVFRLTVSDGELERFDDVAVDLQAEANDPPVVSAGPDQTVPWPATGITLNGSVSDDGRPTGSALTSWWSQVSGPKALVFGDAYAPVTAVNVPAAGQYVLRLSASDTQAVSYSDVRLDVGVSGSAGNPPVVGALSLVDGAVLTKPTSVTGTVDSATLDHWTLEYRFTGEPDTAWVAAATGSTAAVSATLDPTMMLNGLIDVRLSAVDLAGQWVAGPAVFAEVAGGMKVGAVTLSFVDAEVPMAGMPIQVIRTYDSRDRRQGDFGMGWRLSLSNVRLQESGPVGSTWEGYSYGGWLKTYCVRPLRQKRVTVTLPGNQVHSFVAKMEPECSGLIPQQDGTIRFVAQPGTTSTLRPLVNDYVMLNGGFPGPFDLVDYDTLEPFDPDLYVLTLRDGQELIVDDKGTLISVQDLNGNTLSIDRSGVTHSAGKGVGFRRDALGRIVELTDPAGKTRQYRQDARGDLVGYTDAEGNATTLAYDSQHLLLDIVDPRGVRAVRNEYDADGRLIRHTDALGNTVAVDHDVVNRVETVTDRLGNITRHEYDARGNVVKTTDALGQVTGFTYDGLDHKLTETSPFGFTTSYTYNSDGDVLSVTDALGNRIETTYNARGQVLTQRDALGNTSSSSYDARGNLLSTTDTTGAVTGYAYDSMGSLTTSTDAYGYVTRYAYDRFGNQVSQTDALGHVTSYSHDGMGNRVRMTRTRGVEALTTEYAFDGNGRLTRTTAPDGSATATTYNAIGKTASTVDPLGRTTSFQYDDAGRTVSVTTPDGLMELTEYDAEGRRTAAIDKVGRRTAFAHDALGRLTTTTYPDGAIRSATYDAAGRVEAETDERGSITRYTYDAAGRRTGVTDALGYSTRTEMDANGNVTAVTDANGNVTRFEYDAANRRVKTVFADSTFTVTGYDALGRRVAETDQAGVVTQYGYDALGRLTSVTDALGGVTSYAYDELGSQVAQTDANGHVTRFAYDALGRRVKRTLPLGMYETMAYDAAGNLAAKTSFNGHVTTYGYDVMNRLTSKTPDPVLAEPTVAFTYFATGQRATMTDATGVTTYAYDNRDRLTEKATPQGTLFYTHDAAGKVTSIRSSNPGGTDVQYTWNTRNALQDVIDAHAGTFTYSYDGAGNETGLAYPNLIQKTTTYDSNNRLRTIGYQLGATTVASYAYSLGVTGRRTGVVEHSGRTVAYGYDALYRLTSEEVINDPNAINGRVDYTYDPVGNRLRRDSTLAPVDNQAFTYNANDQINTVEQYDLNGNLIQDMDGNTYAYDSENHLISMNGGQVTLAYDGDGELSAKSVAGAMTSFVTDGENPTGYSQVILAVGVSTRATTFGSAAVCERESGSRHYLQPDGQRTVRVASDGLGASAFKGDFDAFGAVVSSAGARPAHVFTGELFLADVDATYLRSRLLAGGRGRFFARDRFLGRLRSPGTLHAYSYVGNDPVNRWDPTGMMELTLSSYGAARGAEAPISVAYLGYGAAIAGLGAIAVLSVKGEEIRGNTVQLAIHLARLLRLSEVGGMPPGEDPDPGDRNDRHWMKEILNKFLKNIRDASKGASRKQVMRELRKRFSDQEIAEILRRLEQAWREFGDGGPTPPMLPP